MSDDGIGLFEAVAVQVGIVVGAGLFSVTTVAVSSAGPAVGISYVVAVVAISLSLVPTAVLGSLYPTTGGNYRYPSRLWSREVAFLAAWGMAVSVLAGGLPLYGLSFGEYLDSLVSVNTTLVGLVVVTVFFLVNLVGIEPAARVQQLMLVTLAVSLVVFIVGGFPAVESANLSPVFSGGVSGAFVGAALLYFVCLGANFIVDIGGDMRDAALSIPRSFLISIPLILVAYVLTSVIAVGIVGQETLAGADRLTVAADAALSDGFATFFTVGALFAIATTVNAVYMIAPKYLIVLAEDGIFPEQFLVTNERFGTNHWGLAFIYVMSLPFLIAPLSLDQHSALMGYGSLVLVIPVMISAISLVRNRPEEYAGAPVHVRPRLLVGIAGVAVVLNIALLALLATEGPVMFVVWFGAVVLGGVYYVARSRYLDDASLRERADEF
jgi:APA family basic amino acid/polyamine antiporter